MKLGCCYPLGEGIKLKSQGGSAHIELYGRFAKTMGNNIANPCLIDVFGAAFTQEDVDFAIPRLHQDIPLYIDPFLFWVSAKPEYRRFHDRLVGFFRLVAEMVRSGDIKTASALLAGCEEQPALGLGYATGSKRGSNVGPKLIAEILRAHRDVPQLGMVRFDIWRNFSLLSPESRRIA